MRSVQILVWFISTKPTLKGGENIWPNPERTLEIMRGIVVKDHGVSLFEVEVSIDTMHRPKDWGGPYGGGWIYWGPSVEGRIAALSDLECLVCERRLTGGFSFFHYLSPK